MSCIKASRAPNSLDVLPCVKAWLAQPDLSELLVNQPNEVFIEKQGVLTRHENNELSPARLRHFTALVATENKQTLGEKNPLLSGSLPDGSRIQIVMPPVSTHVTLSIRRQVLTNTSLGALEDSGYFARCEELTQKEALEATLKTRHKERRWKDFLIQAIQLKKNIVISGGTSTGKTTLLNACLQELPKDERLLLLEDTREMQANQPNVVSLVAAKGAQGVSQVTMQDLVQASLRLRPDRIIMGEIRGKEMLDFLNAASTGHEGTLTTIHANSPSIAFMRMTQLYKLNNVPAMRDEDILKEIQSVVDVIVQLERTPQGRICRSIYYEPHH